MNVACNRASAVAPAEVACVVAVVSVHDEADVGSTLFFDDACGGHQNLLRFERGSWTYLVLTTLGIVALWRVVGRARSLWHQVGAAVLLW